MKKWEYKTLDQMGMVSRGRSKHRPRNDERLFGGPYPFIQTADVKNAELYITEYSQTYSEFGLQQSKLWPKGTLCITIAANIADTALLGIPACFPDSIMGFNAYEGIANTKFVKYSFDILQKQCKQISQGAAQDNMSWEKLSTINFPCPPIEVQNKIATILSRYDDLIENYQKQIKLLEEAAQRLYKEWFVDLHFPGYENVKVVDGVPEGWEKTTLGNIAVFQRGKTITKKKAIDGKYPVVAGGLEPAYYCNKFNTANKVITVSASGANAGFAKMYYENIWASDCSFLDIEQTSDLYFVFCFLKENRLALANLQKGSAQPHVYAKDINALEALKAPCNIRTQFNSLTSNYFNSIGQLTSQLRLLTEARDRLLPKLMSGEIEV